MKYRKKPVIVEAFKWTGGAEQQEYPVWIVEAIKERKVKVYCDRTKHAFMLIETLEGTHKANRGDYIIKGVKGELYACKPNIFEMTYDVVE